MGESKEYMTLPEENGSINISVDVISAIAVGAVREVEGISGMQWPPTRKRAPQRRCGF